MRPKPAHARSLTAQWRTARRLYPIYAGLAEHCQLASPPYKELEGIDERSEPGAMQRVGDWLTEMDQSVQVHQLRQFLQSSGMATSENALQALIDRHLGKHERADLDRDKIDFLLVQYFAICAPPSFHDREVDLEEVAEVLEPVLGDFSSLPQDWLKPLEEMTQSMQRWKTLRELKGHRAIERGRQLKDSSGDRYFDPNSLLAFTRFNYVLRRTFFRLLNAELEAIKSGLRELEARGIERLDCASVQLSAQEPIANLQQVCQNWRRPLISDYAEDRSFERLLGLRSIIEKTLAASAISDSPGDSDSAVDAGLQRSMQEIAGQLAELRGMVAQLSAQLTRLAAATPAAAPPAPRVAVVPASLGDGPTRQAGPAASAPPSAPPAPKVATLAAAAPSKPGAPTAGPPPAARPAAPAGRALQADTASTQSPMVSSMSVARCVEWIREQLLSLTQKKGAPTGAVAVGPTLLTTGEVNAFLGCSDEFVALVQSAVAARALLIDALNHYQRTGQAENLSAALKGAREAYPKFQEGAGGPQQGIAGTETLASAARQLLTVMAYADKALAEGSRAARSKAANSA